MVGIVIVSHSTHLAESVIEMAAVMAQDTPMAAAGGLEDGSFGTSFEKITAAIDSVYSDDGVLVLMDLGSAVMTTEMVLEMMPDRRVEMVDCPLVEGAIVAAIQAAGGADFEGIKESLKGVAGTRKF
ncbi:MAG: PTS-dependent dihydroxyacetone kinase phosphotransferase subunit DhaM [Lachnospiraceae bacterium]|jgi:PTS hybrid protein|nr:PTS-dependent dihydroxyacetone kinase phosphotransferase subunit DhaM [Lachnospiraceae bacterium]